MSVGLVVPACVSGAGDGTDETMPPYGSTATSSQAATVAPARSEGWTSLDLVPYTLGPVSTTAGAAMRPLEARSREDLAEALRPVLLKPEGVFVMREPNWSAADALRAAPTAGHAGDGLAEPPDELRGVSRVIGADGRTLVTDTTVSPHRAIARVLITFDDGASYQCTGTYVGPWTFILAGHCLRQPSGAVARRMVFEPARNGSSLPFGSFDCRNDDASTSNDFLAAIPSGYASSADSTLDFAVIDTWPCHFAPHWLGEPASNQGVLVNPGDTTYAVNGYPGSPCPGAPGGYLYNCGMSGPAYVNGSWVESEHIDTDGGQSGGPWHIGGRVAATHIGYREYFDLFRCGFDVCRRNYGRRMDGTYKSFLDAIAYDYP